MRTDDLIARLAADAVPVTRTEPAGVELVRWLPGATLAVAAGVAIFGARPDLLTRLTSGGYVALWLLTIATSLLAAGSALLSVVPDDRRPAAWRLLPWIAAGAWAGWLIVELSSRGSMWARLASEPLHSGCIDQILAMAIVPGALLYRRLRRAAPLSMAQTAVLASLAALALAAAGSQIICPIDSPAHHLPIHFFPTAMFAVLSVTIARPLLGRLTR